MKISNIGKLIIKTIKSFSEDNVTFLSAALAYYTTFSLAPLLIICIGLAGLFLGKETVESELFDQLQGLFGTESKHQLKTMIAQAMKPSTNIISQIVGVVILIFGASGVFGALQTGLNLVWQVKQKPDRGLLPLIKDRFLSITLVLGVSFLLLVSLVITVILAAASTYLNKLLGGGDIIGLILNYLVSTAIITVLFAIIFKYLPDVKVKWRDVWLGAFITTLLFTLGKFFLGIYFRYSHMGAEFGAASALIIILVWVFYSAQIFFLGAEFTKTYATRGGRRITPSKNAVQINVTRL